MPKAKEHVTSDVFFGHDEAQRSGHGSNAQNSELQTSGVQVTSSLHTLGMGLSRPSLLNYNQPPLH
jgi:hypothetical protein